jgi:hypothetical protein
MGSGVMRMIQMEIRYIELSQIRFIFQKEVSKSTVEMRKSIFGISSSPMFILTVQKDPHEDIYWLISDDEDYFATCEVSGQQAVYCRVTPITDEISQLIEKFKVMNMPRTTKWFDKNAILNKITADKTIDEVSKLTGLTPREMQKYQFHEAVPEHYIKIATENRKYHTIYNRIAKLDVDRKIKEHLFRKASVQDNQIRLKLAQLDQIVRVIKLQGFKNLNYLDKLEMVEMASKYQSILDDKWLEELISRLLKRRDINNKFSNNSVIMSSLKIMNDDSTTTLKK